MPGGEQTGLAALYQSMQSQANMLAYIDIYYLLAWVALLGAAVRGLEEARYATPADHGERPSADPSGQWPSRRLVIAWLSRVFVLMTFTVAQPT